MKWRITRGSILEIGVITALAFMACTENRADSSSGKTALEIDQGKREVRVKATAHPSHFSRRLVQPGHHSIVWEGGLAHYGALFVSHASDHDVRVALRVLGAKPGENLTIDSWEARKDPRNPEPDKQVEGTPIEVFVEWPESGGPRALASLISENQGQATFDFRFGGNERFQPHFRSGCIVCNYSCPGGAIGNRKRSIRDEEKLGVIFRPISSRLPPDGTEVTILFRLRRAGEAARKAEN